MPTYDWKCDKCNKEEQVERPVSRYNEPPDVEGGQCQHEWRKQLNTSLISRSRSWGRKGRWGKREDEP